MIISRLRQGLTFIFCKYNKKNDALVKNILTDEEFNIFNKMSEYDKIHSFNLYELCKENEVLKNDENYLKLALLHDCGKGNYSLIRRMKKVMVGDSKIERHPLTAYEKLRKINSDLAELCLLHHTEVKSKKMKEFQKLDDK